jgi:cell division protein ZapA
VPKKSSVAVTIAGQQLVVRSDADETYVRTLAAYLSERIDEVRSSQRVVPTQKLAILAALNIADELFQERTKQKDLKRRIREKSKRLLSFLDREEKRNFPENA